MSQSDDFFCGKVPGLRSGGWSVSYPGLQSESQNPRPLAQNEKGRAPVTPKARASPQPLRLSVNAFFKRTARPQSLPSVFQLSSESP